VAVFFACFFVFSAGSMFAQNGKPMMFLGFGGAFADLSYTYVPDEPATMTYFQSNVKGAFPVAAAPNCGAIIVDCMAGYGWQWSGGPNRFAYGAIKVRMKSAVIPSGIEVWQAVTVAYADEPNLAGEVNSARAYNSAKWIILRDVHDPYNGRGMYVKYSDGCDVPEATALRIINDLMDNGFEMQILAYGQVRAASSISFRTYSIAVYGAIGR